MATKAFEAPPIHSNYGTLWLSLQARANAAGIEHNHARTVHVRWRTIGKLAKAGRL